MPQQQDRAGAALEHTGKMPVPQSDTGKMPVPHADDTVEIEISIQDLFPQTGPFANLPPHAATHHEAAPPRRPEQRRREEPRRGQGQPPRGGAQPARGQSQAPRGLAYAQAHQGERTDQRRQPAPPPKPYDPADDRPIERRSADSKEAIANRDKLLATKPGDQVYVVPFHKRATLIRLNPDKDQAVVQSGIFEMEIPLADLEPIQKPQPPAPPPPKKPAPRQQKPPEPAASPVVSESAPPPSEQPPAPAEPPPQPPAESKAETTEPSPETPADSQKIGD